MQQQFCTYEIAKRMKELGFKDACMGYYTESTGLNMSAYSHFVNSPESELVAAPLWQQCVDWFRETHRIVAGVQMRGNSFQQAYIPFTTKNLNPNNTEYYRETDSFDKAREAAIIKALELIS